MERVLGVVMFVRRRVQCSGDRQMRVSQTEDTLINADVEREREGEGGREREGERDMKRMGEKNK